MKGFMIIALLLLMASCGKEECRAKDRTDCVCTMEYDPVCGCDGNTYGNRCEAECRGITEFSKGACQ